MALKVIVTGHIVEVYEMERKPERVVKKLNPEDYQMAGFVEEYEDSDGVKKKRFHQYAGEQRKLNEDFHAKRGQKVDRAAERRKQTLRDARNKCRRLALANFGNDSYFLTLTYAENMQDIEKADRDFRNFVKKLRYRHGKSFSYLAVREWQKRGAIHFHMLVDIGFSFVDEEDRKKQSRDLAEEWGNGFCDIRDMWKTEDGKDIDNVGAYLIKYMTKHENEELLRGKKSYLPSRNLVQPIVVNDGEAEEIVAAFSQKKEVFTNSYESEYCGTITYREYNLLRDE